MPGQLKSFLGSMKRRPTKAADGRSDEAAAGAAKNEKTSVVHDLKHLGLKNTKTVAEALTTLAAGKPMDDKELLLENGVSMLQGLPLNSGLSEKVSDGFISMLWNDLPHPPPTLAGPTTRYRTHDGSGNSPWNPEMGKAGSPYSRSVPPMKPKGPALPDPELVYEKLMKRDGPFKEHPSGLNRLFFSFATVVIHECFQTSRKDAWINETSSYVDLSTLYGNTGNEQRRVRTYNNGLIYPDSIASERIMMMPPGVVAILVMFSRNHNQIAQNLFLVNEDSRYKPWDSLDEDGKKWQDEDIFQLSRNINVGFFATVVLKDYVAAILNTPRADSTWSLDLGKEIKQAGSRVERGSGNVVSVEFAVLYHWHAALSAADDKWMEDIIRAALPDLGPIDNMTVELFHKVMMVHGHKLMETPPQRWTFGGLQRNESGSFNDNDLAGIIKSCIEEPAHAFGAHGTPASLKVVDIMGQLQARNQFNVCTMNEFRRYLNLKAYDSFDEWTDDKETARAAELLYGHIENLELYPGLMAECTKPAMPGSGVCPGQTTGRGILDDAVSLVRGDRFLSYDFNSNTLTNWGVSKLAASPPGSYGGMLPQLLFNGLPEAFAGTSPYVLLPFYTPKAVKEILTNNKVIDLYDLTRPDSDRTRLVSVQTHQACQNVLEDHENFHAIASIATESLPDRTNRHSLANGKSTANRREAIHKAFFNHGFEQNVTEFFSTNVAALIRKHSLSFSRNRNSINIVRDVTNIAPILYIARRVAIPLKTQDCPKGLMSIYETFTVLLAVYLYQSFNVLPVNEWKLRDGAKRSSEPLRAVFEAHLKTQKGLKESVVDWLAKGSSYEVGPDADALYHALNESGLPVSDSATELIDLGASIAGKLTHQASLLIDLFLSRGYEQYKERIVQLAHMPVAESEIELRGFVLEGMRHASVSPGLPRVATNDVSITDGTRGLVNIKAGQTVIVATSKAAMDPVAFPEPEKLNPQRNFTDNMLMGYGLQSQFGTQLVAASLAATIREVFKLKNLRRAPGKQGSLTTTSNDVAGVTLRHYLDATAREGPIPTSLVLEYDN
ncbi:linoleate diol synthase [Pseudovirgaria hyperparasitica]|uniref:Linoleate diol synthase n=1 Tax=Pseudovirgaria hyperparasitica TaxID=470096 RepID=A0A6A6VSS1_9PEZI|nr:linoleate diol synthase [Pseudovirgaria hyperparasitica]KAF2752804.1 linoleate diol synthase [Pseudovirgaria hyperparasitica]